MAELSGIVTARGCLLMQAMEGAISSPATCSRRRPFIISLFLTPRYDLTAALLVLSIGGANIFFYLYCGNCCQDMVRMP